MTIEWEAEAMTKRRRITRRARGFLRSTRAVSALEYAILVGVIAVGVTAAIGAFGTQIEEALSKIGTNVINTATPIGTPSTDTDTD